jgi:hypothetical protein
MIKSIALAWLRALAILPLVGMAACGAGAAARAADGCTHTIPAEVEVVDGADGYAHVRPGDTLCLPAGTRGNIKFVNLHGADGSPIVVRNAGGVVTITGDRFLTGGIGIVGSTNIRVTGTGVASACGAPYRPDQQRCGIQVIETHKGIKIDTSKGTPRNVEIDHVFIRDTSTISTTRGIALHPVERQIVSGVYIHHNYITDTGAEGIYMGTEPQGRPLDILGKVEDLEVSHNLVERTGYDGIKIKVAVANIKVHHNVVRDVALSRTPKHDAGIQMAFCVGEYYNNYVENAIEGISMGRILSSPGTRYFNNIVVGARVGITAPEEDALIFNNTVVGSELVGINAPGARAQVFDNIVADTAGTPLQGPAPNLFNNLVGSGAAVGFVDPAGGDYHLRAGSPAVEGGRSVGIFPSADYDGTSRPQGARTDLGAYEYVAPPAAPAHALYVPLLAVS